VEKVMGHEKTTYMFLRNRNGQKEGAWGIVRRKELDSEKGMFRKKKLDYWKLKWSERRNMFLISRNGQKKVAVHEVQNEGPCFWEKGMVRKKDLDSEKQE
jgi:hypothetical protein